MHNAEMISRCWPEWKAVEKLGTGSYGTVYKCCKTEHGVDVYSAIKVISIPQNDVTDVSSIGIDEGSVRQFYKSILEDCVEEIRLLESVKGCVNIVAVEDFQVIENPNGIGGTVFIRMELLNRFSDYMQMHTFDETEAIRFGIDICSALLTCETNHIMHRDVKPGNILMTRYGTYKLGDFGISKKLASATGGLSSKGTRMYMAPEILKGEHYGIDVDLYSLGIVLYQMMNKSRIPFLDPYSTSVSHTDIENALDRRFAGETLPAPCGASTAFAKIILKACAFRPQDRYANAAVMKKDLEMLLLLRTQAADNDYDKTIPIQELTMPVYDADATDVGKTDGGTVGPEKKPDRKEKDNRVKQTNSAKRILPLVAALLCVCAVAFGVFYYFSQQDGLQAEPTATDPVAEAYPTVDAEELEEKQQQARHYYLSGDYKQAVIAYRELVAMQGADDDFTAALVDSENAYRAVIMEESEYLVMQGKVTAAIALLDEALTLLPQDNRLQERRKTLAEHFEDATQAPETTTAQTSTVATSYVYVPQTMQVTNDLSPDDSGSYSQTAYISTDTPGNAGVNLRSEPSAYSEALAVLAEGTQLTVTDRTQNDYTYCYVNGVYGWILTGYITGTTGSSQQIVGDDIVGTARISTETPGNAGVNLRSEPSTYSNGLGVIAEGTLIRYTNRTEKGYTYCLVNGTYGWILTQYIVF